MTVTSLARFYQVEQTTPPQKKQKPKNKNKQTKKMQNAKMQVKRSNSTHFKTKMHGL